MAHSPSVTPASPSNAPVNPAIFVVDAWRRQATRHDQVGGRTVDRLTGISRFGHQAESADHALLCCQLSAQGLLTARNVVCGTVFVACALTLDGSFTS